MQSSQGRYFSSIFSGGEKRLRAETCDKSEEGQLSHCLRPLQDGRPYVEGHLYWTKAKLLADAQNFAEALGYVQKMHALANPLYYERQHQNERIDSLTALWSEK